MDATTAKGGASRRAPASSSALSLNAARSRSFFAPLPACAPRACGASNSRRHAHTLGCAPLTDCAPAGTEAFRQGP